MKVAYLSRGKLYFKEDDLATREIHSEFADDFINRSVQRFQQQEWKIKDPNSPFGQLWGFNQPDPQKVMVQMTGITQGMQPGELLYSLQTDTIGGLFLYDWQKGSEKRLVHKNNFYVKELARHADSGEVICTQFQETGMANIGLIQGFRVVPLTEGDSVDEAPAWIPGDGRQLLFQSAGVARNPAGYPLGIGAFAIQRLDLDRSALETVLAHPGFDYLLPHMDNKGALYYIKRPYEPLGRHHSAADTFKDIIYFPARLGQVFIDWLNFKSWMYSRRPLTMAGGPKVEGDDVQMVILRGRRIDAEKAMRQHTRKTDAPALVPASWELVKRSEAGEEVVLAKHVVAFDVNAAGDVVYTNGTAVYQLDAAGKPQRLLKGKIIDNVYLIHA